MDFSNRFFEGCGDIWPKHSGKLLRSSDNKNYIFSLYLIILLSAYLNAPAKDRHYCKSQARTNTSILSLN